MSEKLKSPSQTHKRAYSAWRGMLSRCSNPSNAGYKHYGARGITVCARWHEFAAFYEDMGDPPAGLSLDRIDNDGNYEPGNCRWATDAQQLANQRRTNFVVVDGERMPIRYAAQRFGIDERTVHGRIRRGWKAADAVRIPSDKRFANKPRSDV